MAHCAVSWPSHLEPCSLQPWAGKETERGVCSEFWGRGYEVFMSLLVQGWLFCSCYEWWKLLGIYTESPGNISRGKLLEQNEALWKGELAVSGFLEIQNGLLELKKRYLWGKKIQYCKFSLHLVPYQANSAHVWFLTKPRVGTTPALWNQAMQCGHTSVQHFLAFSFNIHHC